LDSQLTPTPAKQRQDANGDGVLTPAEVRIMFEGKSRGLEGKEAVRCACYYRRSK
jgi:hypothetical protein